MRRRTLAPYALLALILTFCLTDGVRAETPAPAEFSFVHLTDSHFTAAEDDTSNAAKNASLLREISALNPKPAFIIDTGDVAEAGTAAEYAVAKGTWAKNATVPGFHAPGNHDVRWNPRGKEGFQEGVEQPLYRSFDEGGVHFILLDSTVLLQHWGHFDAAQLDWLSRDLKKTGARTPIIIGFHHWVGRDTIQVDNEQALLQLLAPYNVRLLLIGHGHSDLLWNVDGIPAVMAKGLYQGSYQVVRVRKDAIEVLRRTAETPELTSVVTIPKNRPRAPRWTARASIASGSGSVSADGADLNANAKLTAQVDSRPAVDLAMEGKTWKGTFDAKGIGPGVHTVRVIATLPDGRAYRYLLPIDLRGANAIAPVWSVDAKSEVQGRMTRDGGRLYVSTMGGALVALDPNTGATLWTFKTDGALFGAPCVADGRVFVGSADHFAYAIDAAKGTLIWKVRTGGAIFSGPAVAKGVVCFPSTDRTVYGFSVTDGNLSWRFVGGEGMYQSGVATDGERFFVGCWDNYFRCIDAAAGTELWKQKFGRSFYYAPAIGTPAVANGRAYVTSNDGILHTMNIADGAIVWETPALALGYNGPLVSGDRVYCAALTDDGKVYCFDIASGQVRWVQKTGSVIYDSSCAISRGILFVGSVDGTVSALQTVKVGRYDPGTLLWQYRLPVGHLLSTPVVDAERVYVGSMNGKVTALPLVPGYQQPELSPR